MEREQYNAELEWMRTLPPSDEELNGEIYIGLIDDVIVTSSIVWLTHEMANTTLDCMSLVLIIIFLP